MDLYLEIGKLVSARTEKGAAVAAAEYLAVKCPDDSGFSPRNLRRMRDFFRTYETTPAILHEALLIGWTQNVVSPMAGFVMKNLVEKAAIEDLFYITSTATRRKEIGNLVYPPA